MSAPGPTPVLRVENAVKSFGAVRALDGVSLELRHGEILALLGDNGAGKSTLIKCLSGLYHLDEGQMYLGDEPVAFKSTKEARNAGIETAYQDLALFDNLTPYANFFIRREQTRPRWAGPLGLLAEKRMERAWREEASRIRVTMKDTKSPVGLLSGGQRQAVAVARSVAFAKRVVILDEPTAALGVRESGEVLKLVAGLPDLGIAVILISHNLEHVAQVAHRAVVLRQGRKVGEEEVIAINQQRLVSLIVGAR